MGAHSDRTREVWPQPDLAPTERNGSHPYNAKGALVAEDLDALHAMTGDPELFLDENGDTEEV